MIGQTNKESLERLLNRFGKKLESLTSTTIELAKAFNAEFKASNPIAHEEMMDQLRRLCRLIIRARAHYDELVNAYRTATFSQVIESP
jgi:arsenate reductase-like glutaredoxin family protein